MDTSLTKITWNLPGITQLIDNKVGTFLCTSKWVMQKLQLNILKKIGFYPDQIESRRMQLEIFPFLRNITLSKPVAEVYTRDFKQIIMIALPTPGGGTFRMLEAFGYTPTSKLTTKEFVQLYVESSFRYFLPHSKDNIHLLKQVEI